MDLKQSQDKVLERIQKEQKALGDKINKSIADQERRRDDMINRLDENQKNFIEPFQKSF